MIGAASRAFAFIVFCVMLMFFHARIIKVKVMPGNIYMALIKKERKKIALKSNFQHHAVISILRNYFVLNLPNFIRIP